MKAKKLILIFSIIVLVTVMTIVILVSTQKNSFYIVNDVKTIAIVENKDFLVYSNGEMNSTFLKGVNLGATIPGTFPGELGISKSDYLRWFQQIYDMNANSIRVYTTMKPVFYEALAEFNEGNDAPLYLLQGVWLNEDKIAESQDIYANNDELLNELLQDSIDLVDIFHGNITLPERPGFASGTYTADVSKYVIGWIVGVEWDPLFVNNTNSQNPESNSYQGTYLYTENASPFETFLAKTGDLLLEYEIDKYQTTRPISFTNWLTTDLLTHSNEPDFKEDFVEVNTEHIKTTLSAFAGMFASYHIYPYYPEFMNFEPKYQEWIDPETGEPNPYKAYLIDLIDAHTIPVLVAEFGIPSSRGKAHNSMQDNFNQGSHTETEQGDILASLFNDIVDTNYMGALIFSWQDEWFKRTWNTMDFDLAWQRPMWSNVETNEQFFGLLSFEPGAEKTLIHTDGDTSDWNNMSKLVSNNSLSLSVAQDSRYLYLFVEDETMDFTTDKIYISLDTIANQGNTAWDEEGISFDQETDFVVLINGEEHSKLVVDSYYDSYRYLYAEVLNLIPYEQRVDNSGVFNNIYHVLSNKITLPLTGEVIPFSTYDAGILRHGNSNPDSTNFDNLSDFYIEEHSVEIRIPWLLLNVMDPSTKQVMSNFGSSNQFQPEVTPGFHFNVVVQHNNEEFTLPSTFFTWDNWDEVVYHERLKESYYIIQDLFRDVK